ncbi:MAG: biotin/lipoyl-binding protein [Myxococcales bacterium]
MATVRYLLPILGLLLVIGGLAGVKFSQFSSLMSAGEKFAKMGPPPETVSTDVSRKLVWEGSLSAVGSIAAVRGVAISNESPGVVKKILFESGNMAKAGQVLVELDTSVEQAQLATTQARRQLAEQTLARTQALSAGKAVPKSQIDNDEAQLKSVTAEVAGLEAQNRAQSHPRTLCRQARDSRGEPRPVSEPRHGPDHARSARLGVRRLHVAAAGPG